MYAGKVGYTCISDFIHRNVHHWCLASKNGLHMASQEFDTHVATSGHY